MDIFIRFTGLKQDAGIIDVAIITMTDDDERKI